MKIILLEKIASLGAIGDMVTVKNGYARNYLIPFGKASVLSDDVLEKVKVLKEEEQKREALNIKNAQARAAAFSVLEKIVISVKASDEKLFGSVGAKDIIDALADKGVAITKSELVGFKPIRNLGDYTIQVRLYGEVTASFQLSLEPIS